MNTVAQDNQHDDLELAESLIDVDDMLVQVRERLEQSARRHATLMHLLARRTIRRLSDGGQIELDPRIVKALGGDFARTTLLVEAERMGALPPGFATIQRTAEVSEEHMALARLIEAATP